MVYEYIDIGIYIDILSHFSGFTPFWNVFLVLNKECRSVYMCECVIYYYLHCFYWTISDHFFFLSTIYALFTEADVGSLIIINAKRYLKDDFYGDISSLQYR